MNILLTVLLALALLGPLVTAILIALICVLPTSSADYFLDSKDTLQLPKYTETNWSDTLSHEPDKKKIATCKRECCKY